MRAAVMQTPRLDRALLARIDKLATKLADLDVALNGDDTVSRRQEPTAPGINGRVGQVMGGLDGNLAGATTTMREQLALAAKLFGPVLAELGGGVQDEIKALETELEKAGAPYTPGRIPAWSGK
jgi:hypothetical protein